MQHNPVGYFEIYVQDMARAGSFYETVLKLKLERQDNPASMQSSGMDRRSFPAQMEQYGAGGALVKMPGMSPGGNGVLVYFACNDCAAEASRVASAGGTLVREKFSIGEYGHIALAVDTEGNTFGLHSMA